MKKTNAFNFEMFKNGKAAQTKLGNPVKFICLTGDKMLITVYHRSRVFGNFEKFVGNVFDGSNEKYNLNGKKYNGTDTMYDLEMVENYTVNGPARDPKTGRFMKKN